MKTVIRLFIALSVILTGCKDHEPQVAPPPTRTVVVYMAAENRLQYNAQQDLAEMQRAKEDIPAGSQVVVFVDDCKSPRIYRLTSSGMTLVKEYEEDFISTSAEEMTRVLDDIYTRFRADSYGLVLWSHGSGWIPGTDLRNAFDTFSFGTDNGSNSSHIDAGTELSITTLAEVLGRFPRQEFILFDCCLMQCIEVAYELKDIARYVIGSPAEIPAAGAPYDKIMPHLFARSFTPESLIRTYHADYSGSYYGGVLLSAVVTSELPELARLTGELFTPLCNGRNELSTEDIQHYNAYCYVTGYAPEYFDMNGVMKRHLAESAYGRWYEQFDRAVVSRYASPRWITMLDGFYLTPEVKDLEAYGGVTIFVPQNKYERQKWNEHFHRFRWYTDAGWAATGW